MIFAAIAHLLLLLTLPPLLIGLVQRTKALVAGRKGPPLLQLYWDLLNLLQKGAVYSVTTTWVFRAGPVVNLAALIVAGALVPVFALPGPLAFQGDVILFAAFLALARFATVLAALDTGSSFEGMGASREATFGGLSEPVLFACLLVLAVGSRSLCLTEILGPGLLGLWLRLGPALLLVGVSFGVLLLAENCRIPVDDPTTHLELTMIHEVMVLDHGGPDLAFILYGAALKLYLFAAVLVRVLIPVATGVWLLDALVFGAGVALVGVLIGLVESWIARLRMPRVPTFLGGALVLATIAVAVLLSTAGDR